MKNILESLAVLLVGVLSLLIVYLIVQYNLIEDDNVIEDMAFTMPIKKATNKESTADYLNDMEQYTDVDVQVDPTKENSANSVAVKSELSKDRLKDAVDDNTKKSYTKVKKQEVSQKVIEVTEVLEETVPAKKEVLSPDLPKETIDDEIGEAIDKALDDL